MASISSSDLRIPLRYGLIAGGVSLSLSAIGMIELFGQRELVAGILTLGQVILLAAPVLLSFMSADQAEAGTSGKAYLYSLFSGVVAVLPLLVLIIAATNLDLRQFLPNVSPALMDLLTFGQGVFVGSLILVGVFALTSLAAAVMNKLPDHIRSPLFTGLITTLTLGLFSEILSNRLRAFFGSGINRLLFDGEALNPLAALILFAVITGIAALWGQGYL